MYATIRRYALAGDALDQLSGAGRALAIRLSRVPGFVSFAALDGGAGVLAAVSFFETAADLAAADRLVAAWEAEHRGALLPRPPGRRGAGVAGRRVDPPPRPGTPPPGARYRIARSAAKAAPAAGAQPLRGGGREPRGLCRRAPPQAGAARPPASVAAPRTAPRARARIRCGSGRGVPGEAARAEGREAGAAAGRPPLTPAARLPPRPGGPRPRPGQRAPAKATPLALGT